MKLTFANTIDYYQFAPEGQFLDRKSARIKPISILKHLVAFANAEGGQLVIGIEDDGEMTGFEHSNAHKIDEYRNICLIELKETPLNTRFDVITVENSKGQEDVILVISVEISSDRVIKSYDGKVYLRQNDKTIELNYEQVVQLQYDRGQRFFEDEIVEDADMSDIDEELLNEYKTVMNITELSHEEVLKARNFLRGGKLTNASILLFGKNPSRFLPQARLRVIRYSGTKAMVGTEINIIKERTFDGAIPKIIRESCDFINTQLREFQYLDRDGKFKIMPEYPEFAWFEGIVNALTHRNYSLRGEHIKVLMYDDRLEILSPGRLPNIVTVENIFNQRYSRNPRIARVLSEFGWVKEMNEGVKRIYSEMEKLFLNKPQYSEPNNNSVQLALENNILNRQMRTIDRIKKALSEEKFETLSMDERAVLQYMYNTGDKMTTKKVSMFIQKSPSTSRKILQKLEREKLLIWYGNSKNDSNQYYLLNI